MFRWLKRSSSPVAAVSEAGSQLEADEKKAAAAAAFHQAGGERLLGVTT